MPELPEVETVMRGLEKALGGKKVKSIVAARKNLRIPFPRDLGSVAGTKVTGFSRRAKYILMSLSSKRTMIIHLGMSGRMTINPDVAEKHDHMTMVMQDGTRVVFNDPRRFGLVDLCDTGNINSHRFFSHLGPEPFDRVFCGAYLDKEFKNKKVAIKLAIMDQRVVVGVGNIYAAEALYIAGIDPRRPAMDLKPLETKALAAAIRAVLKKAIKAGGSSLRDYVQADGELGYFQHHWAVYDKAGQKCPKCKKPCVMRITQGGRSTYYCPNRQK